MNTRLVILLVSALSVLPGCASTLQTPLLLESQTGQLPEIAVQEGLPFFAQDEYQCGPAALATVLVAAGVDTSPEALVPRVYVPGKTGTYQLELVTASRDAERLAYPLDRSMHALLSELAAGHPVLVMQNLGIKIAPQWHFAVATGYDLGKREIILNSGEIRHYRVGMKTFERTWARSEYWGLVILAPGNLPVTADPTTYLKALADLEHNRPDSKAVAAYYGSAVTNWPEHAELRMAYGNLLYAQGDSDAAARQFSIITTQHADYAPAFNNLAWIEYEQSRLDAALQHAEQAVQLGGEHAATYEDTRKTILTARNATRN